MDWGLAWDWGWRIFLAWCIVCAILALLLYLWGCHMDDR